MVWFGDASPLEGCLPLGLLIRKWSCVGGVCFGWSSVLRMSCFCFGFGLLGNIINVKALVTERILPDTVESSVIANYGFSKTDAGLLSDSSNFSKILKVLILREL